MPVGVNPAGIGDVARELLPALLGRHDVDGLEHVEVVAQLAFEPVERVEVGLDLVGGTVAIDLAHIHAAVADGQLEDGDVCRV